MSAAFLKRKILPVSKLKAILADQKFRRSGVSLFGINPFITPLFRTIPQPLGQPAVPESGHFRDEQSRGRVGRYSRGSTPLNLDFQLNFLFPVLRAPSFFRCTWHSNACTFLDSKWPAKVFI